MRISLSVTDPVQDHANTQTFTENVIENSKRDYTYIARFHKIAKDCFHRLKNVIGDGRDDIETRHTVIQRPSGHGRLETNVHLESLVSMVSARPLIIA